MNVPKLKGNIIGETIRTQIMNRIVSHHFRDPCPLEYPNIKSILNK